MFEYLRGKLTEASVEKAVVDISGLGYRLHIPFSNFAKLPAIGHEVFFYISSYIREDCHKNFGFLTREERDLFEEFLAISGVGPKTALALVGHLELADLYFAIAQKNIALLCKIPGIGKKTAERLVVELKDRPRKQNFSAPSGKGKIAEDAVSALVNLGYQPLRAQKAVKNALDGGQDKLELAQLITASLRHI